MAGECIPIVCDMTGAADTPAERLEAYAALFADALVGRERTAGGIRFRFADRPGVQARVLDLAAKEKACCPFFTFAVGVQGDEVWWDASVVDDAAARAVLDGFFALPETGGAQVPGFDAMKTVQPMGGVESERSAP
jgi:hypothetical protein